MSTILWEVQYIRYILQRECTKQDSQTPINKIQHGDTWMKVSEKKSTDGTSTIQVNSLSSFNNTITNNANAMGASDNLTIQITVSTLTLDGNLTPINTAGMLTIEAADDSNPVTIDGQGWWHGLVVLSCQQLNLNSLIFKSTSCRGAPGCLGAGGGLLIANVSSANGANGYSPNCDSAPNVILSDVSFLNCSAIGGSGMSTGANGGAGGIGGAEGQGDSGSDGASPNSLLGVTQPGYFGNCAGGSGGDGGSGTSFWNGTGNNGSSGGSGGDSGYGAGAGGGGGGGGGAAGYSWLSSSTGGNGGNGGDAGTPGFGGSNGGSGENGQGGLAVKGDGPGGAGGRGSLSGAGAAFGGAIFIMQDASLQIYSLSASNIASGEVKGGSSSVVGGSDGAAAGTGMFLQGSGFLNFIPEQTYTISDSIVDEVGAVAMDGVAESNQGNGPDGLPMGGGHAVWGLIMTGNGILSLQGEHAFYGEITLSDGTLDLSDYQNQGANEFQLNGGTLKQQPTSATTLTLGNITMKNAATLALNGYSNINTPNFQLGSNNASTSLTIDFDDTGFSGTSQVILTSGSSIPSTLKLISASKKYKCLIQDKTIVIQKK